MQLSTRGRYAVMAMVDLAMRARCATLSSPPSSPIASPLACPPVCLSEIAAGQHLSLSYLEQLFGKLRRAGLVTALRGPGGGYRLARIPSEIKIGQVIRTIDGPLAPIACASRTAYQPCRDCSNVKACSVRLMMTKVRDAISDVLDSVTLADMIAKGGRRNMARVKPVRKSRALSKVSGTGKAARKSRG